MPSSRQWLEYGISISATPSVFIYILVLVHNISTSVLTAVAFFSEAFFLHFIWHCHLISLIMFHFFLPIVCSFSIYFSSVSFWFGFAFIGLWSQWCLSLPIVWEWIAYSCSVCLPRSSSEMNTVVWDTLRVLISK